MIVTIEHETNYQYLDRVFLEPHTLRLTPRQSPGLRVYDASMDIDPQPQGINIIQEEDGTQAHLVWFNGMTKHFRIRARTEIELNPINPFEFLIYPTGGVRLPMVYPSAMVTMLEAYRQQGAANPDVKSYAVNLAEDTGQQTVDFLSQLIQRIHTDLEYEKREQGCPHPAQQTLEEKKGSCRDFAILAIDVCRAIGLAARFVSGYYFSHNREEPSELHAWVEVYLPGAGWKGYDPTHGVACDHHHIALAASAQSERTLPVTGTFRGFASSRITTKLSMLTS